MSKKDVSSESLNSRILQRGLPNAADLLQTNSRNNQRSRNSRNNVVPNFNVVRNKNLETKTSEKDSKKDANNRGRNQRGKDGRPNNSRRNNQNLVQTMGFFSEGISEVPRKASEYSGGYSKDGSSVEAIQKPRLTRSDARHNKEELEKEQTVLNNLLEEDDIDDEDSKTSSDDIAPIKISHGMSNSSKVGKVEKLEEVKIKVEPVGVKDGMYYSQYPLSNGNAAIKIEPGTELKSELYHKMDKLFNVDPNHVVLFQMPDNLPQKLPDEEEETRSKEEDEDAAKVKPLKLSSLEHFNEGLIGKLIRHRSGKTKLMIGDYMYDVDNAIYTEFQQHAVSINANPQERSANMYSLGEIDAKYNVIPDWNWLFDKVVKP